ncbi:hypothetical protein [Teredinibacter turnerae]|uniref:hypothetical protein n=1 Tax=Teredinibacter turnerae TaxID=2426 RepID=UPI0030CFAE03
MANNNLDVFHGFAVEKMEFVETDGGVFQLRVRLVAAGGGGGYFVVSGARMNVQGHVHVGGDASPLVSVCSWDEGIPKDSVA